MSIAFTENRLSVIEHVIEFSEFTSAVQIVELPNSAMSQLRILRVTAIKEVAFNEGTIQVGNGTATSTRETFATAAEMGATATGTADIQAWRTANFFNPNIVGGGSPRLFVRYAGAAPPTAGLIRLLIEVWPVSPRSLVALAS